MTNPENPYQPNQDGPRPGGNDSPPQFGQRSENWQPNPSPGPAESQSPWPVYQPGQTQPNSGQPAPGQPAQGQPYPGQQYPGQQFPNQPAPGGPTYGAPQPGGQVPYPGQQPGYGPIAPPQNLPSRAWPIVTLVSGIVAMIVVAPAIFITLILSGMDIESIASGSVTAYNGGEVVVDSSESLVLVPQDQREITSCTLTQGGNEITIYQESATGLVSGHNIQPGTYTVECGIGEGAPLYAFSGDQISGMFSGVTTGLLWSSIVGVLGLVAVIVGIVWLVRKNRARREALRMQWGPTS